MKAERRDGDTGRFYRIGGMEYPSVTTVLSVIGKPALVNWAAKVERELVIAEASSLHAESSDRMSGPTFALRLQDRLGKEKAHKKELAKAGEIGSQVHALIEWTLRTELMEKCGSSPEIGPKAQWAFASWQKWRQSVNLKPIWVERSVCSAHYGYAGTADLLALVNGVETLLDWKSGKAIYPESFLQNVAYREAIWEQGVGYPVQGMIVRLPKIEGEPDFEVKKVPDNTPELLEVFLHALELWKWHQAAEAARKEVVA